MVDIDQTTQSKNFRLVVAIDLGTSLSGFAYSDVKTRKNRHPEIHHSQCWNSTGKYTDIRKTATCILFDKDKQFVSFGYDAKLRFAEMDDRERWQHYFFDNFKMALYNNKGSVNAMELFDIGNKRMLATDVFTASIKTIKDQVLLCLKKRGKEAPVEEIRWVLTVPAIWPEKSKLFMKECAEKAGIPPFQLLIALEPEAASLHCQNKEMIKTGERRGVTKYMVVDIGGGTTDITVHEKTDDGGLKELCPVQGSNIGGTTVDLALLHLFEKIISSKLLQSCKRDKPVAFFDLYEELEVMKKSIHPDRNKPVSIKIPHSTLTQILNKYTTESLKQTIYRESTLNNIEAMLKDDRIFFSIQKVKELLNREILKIIVILRDTIKTLVTELSFIFLVGGFAENSILLNEVKAAFTDINVLVPEEPGLAILKGAVLFGQNPETIHTRITRFTYGLAINNQYTSDVHSESKAITNEWGTMVCTGCFSVIMRQNKSVKLGKTIRKKFYSCNKFQETIDFEFYSATTDDPLYVNDKGCSLIGKYTMKIQNPSSEIRVFDVTFLFGDTTIKISIKDADSGNLAETKIDL